jgi:hypothetical protein
MFQYGSKARRSLEATTWDFTRLKEAGLFHLTYPFRLKRTTTAASSCVASDFIVYHYPSAVNDELATLQAPCATHFQHTLVRVSP